jgi:hypothetical protein
VSNAFSKSTKDVKSCINYNNCKSDYFACDMAVRQGENLYPFLFALFLNDLQSFLEKENLLGLKTISEKIEENLNTNVHRIYYYTCLK